MLRLFRNHSAFNSHNFPRTMVLWFTLLPPSLIALIGTYLVGRRWFGNYLRQIAVLAALFHAASFHSLFSQVSFAAVSAQGFARPLAGLLATHLAIVYSVYSAYLPGLHSARPSAFVEGAGVEPAAHPRLFGESPLCATVGHIPLFHLPVCPIVSGFFLPCVVSFIAP